MNKNTPIIIVLSLVLLLTGCHPPVRDFSYAGLDSNGHNPSDTIWLSLDITDSTSTYGIYYAVRVDKTFLYPTVDADLSVISPSGLTCKTAIHIPADELFRSERTKVESSDGTYNIEWRWKEALSLKEAGKWRFALMLTNGGTDNDTTIKGIHEIGINCRKNERKR